MTVITDFDLENAEHEFINAVKDYTPPDSFWDMSPIAAWLHEVKPPPGIDIWLAIKKTAENHWDELNPDKAQVIWRIEQRFHQVDDDLSQRLGSAAFLDELLERPYDILEIEEPAFRNGTYKRHILERNLHVAGQLAQFLQQLGLEKEAPSLTKYIERQGSPPEKEP